MQVKIIKNINKFLTLSLVMVIASLITIFTKGLNYGIDFSGGNLIQVKYDKVITPNEVNAQLNKLVTSIPQLAPNSRKLQVSEKHTLILRTQELTEQQKDRILLQLKNIGTYSVDKVEKVGASIGEELKSSAVYALIIGAILITIYITVRFEFVFSLGGIISLIHDLIIAIGVISFLGYEVDTPFIAAILTILGYSINDTIVVFDRIRENIKRQSKEHLTFEEILDKSINQVIVRSFNTSITTLFAIIAILIFGGTSLRTFITTLLIGILAGTYSSIFVATPIVYLLDKYRRKNGKNGIDTKLKENSKIKETKEKILV